VANAGPRSRVFGTIRSPIRRFGALRAEATFVERFLTGRLIERLDSGAPSGPMNGGRSIGSLPRTRGADLLRAPTTLSVASATHPSCAESAPDAGDRFCLLTGPDDPYVARLSENSRGPTTSCTSMTRSRFCAGPFRSRELRFGRLPRSCEVPPKRRCHFRTTARNSPTASRHCDRPNPLDGAPARACGFAQIRSSAPVRPDERDQREGGVSAIRTARRS
jgi:hypothetical protein